MVGSDNLSLLSSCIALLAHCVDALSRMELETVIDKREHCVF